MVQLGKIQKVKVVRKAPIGVYVKALNDKDEDAILLPNNQLPEVIEVDDEIDVFVYKDSEDRIIATRKVPKITLGELAALKVKEITKIGTFLDWGLEKDLLLPFREQVGNVKENGTCLVALYVDNSNRLCATMDIHKYISRNSPYKANDWVKGTVYSVSKEMGALVAVDNRYLGVIPPKELYRNLVEGDSVDVRVKMIRQGGKLELSLRKEAYNEMEDDAKKIMDKLELNGGKIKLNDKSDPELIKRELGTSKAAFKRAVGRLLKEGAIKFTDDGIERNW